MKDHVTFNINGRKDQVIINTKLISEVIKEYGIKKSSDKWMETEIDYDTIVGTIIIMNNGKCYNVDAHFIDVEALLV